MNPHATIRNALRLALDPAAGVGEQQAAMMAILRIARANKWDVAELLRQLGVASSGQHAPPPPPPPRSREYPPGWDVEFAFGKHRGRTVGAVATSDPDYLYWIVENFHGLRPRLRRAIETALEWIEVNA